MRDALLLSYDDADLSLDGIYAKLLLVEERE
jgi:hypothetical protein